MSQTRGKFVRGRNVAITFATFALSVFAILIWGRLKLVAGVPRTAYAVPKQAEPQPQPEKKPEVKKAAAAEGE